MTKIKLCGIKSEDDIKVINEVLPDYIGFVFAGKSKRYISFDKAKKLKNQLDDRIKAVGVFVNDDIENIAYLVKNKIIDIVQLHGNEDESYINTLKTKINVPIIYAYQIKSKADIKSINKNTDFILLDAGAGCGETFNEALLEGFDNEYFLAGGLSVDNIKEKIMKLHPYGVDVSSGIETEGKKDAAKIRKFVSLVREVDNDR
ncbi:phosphoribosylanthranilate isomerase [Lachnoanaerobaculum gingivalis]|uniref:N-(5'-phosphoribosyl)anthranilate isomerase n=1 Tax=Lachnoanaerobaculum gingivalis TaxID=2490855 RepID=A0A3P3QTQ7_9FIRM|nr:phosphoribosylanthranilate isomerase [Lachnoanaerobaculum gingivalis]RRJ24601.1 phosphoribosylanthranilate isomerase [Lachnoanaerobaculum gingivalis]